AKIESLPGAETPVLMTSQRMLYERKQRWIRIEGGANLRRGEDWITARRIFGNLNDDETALKFVHAFWDIRGEMRSITPVGGAATATRTRFNGQDLAVVFQPEGNQARRVQLEGKGDSRVTLESVAPGKTRTLTARRIEGLLAQGVLSNAEAFGGVDIRENSRVDGKTVTRQASGQRATADFRPDGQIATANLNMGVTYRDPQVTASGNRVALEMDENRGEFFGSPVVITTDRGKVESPRVVYNTDQQIVHARAGVKAVLQKVEETALAGTPLSEGEGPVHVESQEAFWRQEPSSFLFRGDVRAWRGENLLLAPELKGDKTADQLTATGGEKTLWFPTEKQAKGNNGKPAGQRPSMVQVVAREMNYQDQKGVLIYTGNVRVDQEGKTLACQRLEVEMDDEHQAETMTCTGDTKVNDPKVGRGIEGQRAVYHVDRREVEVFGDPVVMSDKDGNQVRGRRALYYIDDGKMEVKGKDETAPAATPAVTPTPTPAPTPATPQGTQQQGTRGSGG
ncbi:MAG TPA: LptA/OstA family protein, partial [Myxococcota bacterium]|nr:LptA/OstA family protein [Myxococcota bacterium]